MSSLVYTDDSFIISGFIGILLLSGVALVALYLLGYEVQFCYGRYNNLLPYWCGAVGAKKAWFIQELPSLVIPIALLAFSGGEQIKGEVTPNLVLLAMYLMHYVQRTFIFSLCIKGGKPTPVPTLAAAFLFCCVNGYLQGRTLTHYYRYNQDWLWSPQFIVGLFTFLLGMAINIHSDNILRNLRKPGETGYKIPRGGMFEFVSGANFFGESLEWVGYAVSSWSLAATTFAIFTVCYLGTRALSHHRFYQQKFEEYPLSRKAFIPFLI